MDGLGLALTQGVDCWIGVVQLTDRRVVRLAGRLSAAQVPELIEACAQALRVEIKLTDLIHPIRPASRRFKRCAVRGSCSWGRPAISS